MKNRDRKYLDFMGAYWSLSPDAFNIVVEIHEKYGFTEFGNLDVKQLKRKPRGEIYRLRQDLRTEN